MHAGAARPCPTPHRTTYLQAPPRPARSTLPDPGTKHLPPCLKKTILNTGIATQMPGGPTQRVLRQGCVCQRFSASRQRRLCARNRTARQARATAAAADASLIPVFRQSTAGLMRSSLTRSLYCASEQNAFSYWVVTQHAFRPRAASWPRSRSSQLTCPEAGCPRVNDYGEPCQHAQHRIDRPGGSRLRLQLIMIV